MAPNDPRRARAALAFAVIYLVWGSTYLATRWVVEVLPPALALGVRFVLAGSILLAIGKLRGEALPTRRHWPGAAAIGVLLFVCGSGSVAWAQAHGVASGTAALLVATVPLWMTLLARLQGERTPALGWLGLAVGFVGTAVLARPGGDVSWHAGLIVIGTLGWAGGSLLARKLPAPDGGSVAAGAQMLCGGLVLVVLGASTGELAQWPAELPMRALWAWLYLAAFGSVVAFRAYTWLLANVAPAKVGTYAYVNPLVAVVLGAAAGEPISLQAAIAMALVVTGVACTVAVRSPSSRAAIARSSTRTPARDATRPDLDEPHAAASPAK